MLDQSTWGNPHPGNQLHLERLTSAGDVPTMDPGFDDLPFTAASNEDSAQQFGFDTSYGINESNPSSSLMYSDFLKDLLFTPPEPSREMQTPVIWASGFDMELQMQFGDTLAGVPFGDIPPIQDGDLFAGDQSLQLPHEDAPSPEQQALAAGAQAFSTSVWHWVPSPADHASAEHYGLAPPSDAVDQYHQMLTLSPEILLKRLRSNHRDRVLAVLLEQCEKENIVKIATAFPSHNLMEKLVHTALHFQAVGTIPFVHVATFDVEAVKHELLVGVVAYGAFLSPVSAIQHLGAAMADILFMVLPDRFCSNNANTRNLQLLQCFALFLQILFWSGNKRRTEIGESFSQPLMTMLRRANCMDRHHYQPIRPFSEDNDSELTAKWRSWVDQESYIRLVHHVFLHDAHVSMTHFTSPLLTSSEMTLPLPAADALWNARDAREWREAYHSLVDEVTVQNTLSTQVHRVLNDNKSDVLSTYHNRQLAERITLTGVWHFVWVQQLLRSWRPDDQLSNELQDTMSPISAAVLHKVLVKVRDATSTSAAEGSQGAIGAMISHYLTLTLSAPLKTFPVFAGRDGEGEARRVYLLLQEWASSRESRQAIWHSGQILRNARAMSQTQQQTIFAVLIYHASLTLWTFSIIASARHKKSGGLQAVPGDVVGGLRLDGEATIAEVNEFVALGNRSPVISSDAIPLLSNPGAAMMAGIRTFGLISTTQIRGVPRFIESLVQLMGGLSGAAQSLGFG